MNIDLTQITSITEYFDKLDEIKAKSLILIAVKDNAGYWLNEEIQAKLSKLGLSQSLIHEEMVGYVAAISDGIVICEQKSPKDGIEEYQGLISGKKIYLLSKPYLSGNTSSIQIDGKEYSNNSRGLNIVVYDNESNRVVDRVSFDTHVQEYDCVHLKTHYDIGIFGWWYNANYGATLTYYALNRAVRDMGYSVVMLFRGSPSATMPKSVSIDFAKRHYDISPRSEIKDLCRFNDLCDTFLLGSDQLWNPDLEKVAGKQFFLDFADDKRLIAYAQSFGNYTRLPEEFTNRYKGLVNRFDAVSVREDYATRTCKDSFGINVPQVCDPVFLVDKKCFEELVDDADIELPNEYLMCFILDPTREKIQLCERVKEKIGVVEAIYFTDLDGANDKAKQFEGVRIFPSSSIENFVKAYQGAKYIITDSFHGTCLSIIFEKNFISLANQGRGKGRFESLMRWLHLESRLFFDLESVIERVEDEVDYTAVREIVTRGRIEGLEWLRKALAMKKTITSKRLKEFLSVETNGRVPENKDGNVVSDVDDRLVRNPEFIKIRILASLLHDYGVKHIVLSPGGRDIPLVRIFEYNEKDFILHRVTDERSAAYYGLGIASAIQQPVACVCTSGTAASNYLPAVTEAFYTGIPLIVITADRLGVYLNQGEDQTIPQKEIYKNVVKKEISLPEGEGYRVEYQVRRDVSDCILESMHHTMGPVHINVPVDDNNVGFKASRDAWRLLPKVYPHLLRVGYDDGEKRMLDWVKELKKSQRILVVYGQQSPLSVEEKKYVEAFASKYNCVIVTEHISNYEGLYALKPANLLLSISQKDFDEQLSPDILITVGGKRFMNDPLTFKIRHGKKNIRHWSVSPDGKVKDFYFRLTSVIEMSQGNFFKWFSEHADSSTNNGIYYEQWRSRIEKCSSPINSRFNTNYLLEQVLPQIPSGSLLHFGVGITHIDSRKYDVSPNVECYCNMGTNGIDGCTSTFMGASVVNKNNLAFLIVGDLSFFYDMNSIWNKELTSRIRILLMNNKGSGLLRGTGLKAIASSHNTSAKGWVESVGFTYLSASDASEFNDKLKIFLSDNTEEPIFFEVFCE